MEDYCISCGKSFECHSGLQGTCLKLQNVAAALKESIEHIEELTENKTFITSKTILKNVEKWKKMLEEMDN